MENFLTSAYIPQYNEWVDKYGYENLANALTQGLNLGDKGIADWQQLNNIRIPQTQTDIDLARAGLFNDGLPNMENNYLSASADKQPTKFDNLLMGYKDNYLNPIGRTGLPAEKNWATRIGEGLGTLGRFIDSPLGRGLIATGLNKAMGYDNSWQEGLTAAVGRQNAMTADKVYRNQLKQYGYTDEDLADIKGNITSDIYKNLTTNIYRNKQLEARLAIANAKDNTQRAKMILDGFKNGMLSQDDVINELAKWGISLSDLQQSNESLKTASQVETNKARTKKLEAEAKNVGKPKVTVNIKKGGTKSVIEHVGGSGGTSKVEDTQEYKNDLAQYIRIKNDPKYRKQWTEADARFAGKYGKLPKVN